MWKLLLPFIVLLLAVGAAVVSDRPQPPADFTFVNRGDVSTLDLQKMSWMQDLRVAGSLFETLINNDLFSWEYAKKPGVAERWEMSPDGRTYTFHLRADARWSNGERVTAGDFVYAWRRGMLPDTASDYITMYQLVRGARAFYDWRDAAMKEYAQRPAAERTGQAAAELWQRTVGTWGVGGGRSYEPGRGGKFEELVGLRAPDDRTLVVELERPTPYFLDIMAYEIMGPVFPPLLERFTTLDPVTGGVRVDPGWTKPGQLVGNGPFKLTLWRFKRDMRLERNPYYWNSAAIQIDSMAIPSIADGNAMVLAFQTGAVDWLSDVTPDYRADMLRAKREYYREHQAEYDRLKALGLDAVAIDRALPPDPRQNIHAFPAFGTYFYSFNCLPRLADGRPNPFADARVRRAFALALDKDNIARNVRRIDEPTLGSMNPPGTLADYTPPRGLPSAPDPAAIAEAQRLMAEAGYPGGRGFIKVTILFNTEGGHARIAESVKRDWEQNLGVEVDLAQREVKVFRNDRKNTNFIVARGGWFGDYGDPTTFLDLFRSDDGNNDGKYNNPRFDAMLDAAAAEQDPARRRAILEEAERFLMEEELPVIPIFQYNQVYMFDPHRVAGISPHPRQKQKMHLVRLLDREDAGTPPALPPRPLPAGATRSDPAPDDGARSGASREAAPRDASGGGAS